MSRWLGRRAPREHDLLSGVDADLVQANRRRAALSWYFFAAPFLMVVLQAVITFTGPWRLIALGLTCLFFLCGVGLGHWSYSERAFLNKPEPEEPAKLFRPFRQ